MPYANGAACQRPSIVTTYVTESRPTSTPVPSTTYSSIPTTTPLSFSETRTSTSTESFSETPTSTSSAESSSTLIPTPSAGCRPASWTREGDAPSVGTLRAGIIFVDFPDSPANTTVNELYDFISTAPADLYREMSYGKLNLELVPMLDRFTRMPSVSTSYNYSRGLTSEAHVHYINDALTAVGASVSFKGIDVLYVIPAKYANEISASTATKIDVTAADGTVIGNTITYGQDLYNVWGPKTVNHETGHAMGLPDLYPYVGGEVTQWVGGFDLMGLIGGMSPDYFAWHKWQLGWIDETQVECVASTGKTTYRISPIEVASEDSKLIAVPLSSTAYVLAEVRSNLGINEGACGVGVLLYTADTTVFGGSGPIRVIDSTPNSGGCDFNKGGELNDATLAAGLSWDTGLGVVFHVTAEENGSYVLEVDSQI
ncbi:M6 metalloprotease [Amniculicola lignicola CBS 123094]|uniref:M6 metalloprotease n=1 Tax=Amniculicola lignicola CBS 123094 TaxID=1392246 RepID=A0A6A5VXX8_9PLEO|nr:M6 metalloprotease [Amniculicola lignicola CBS 123094]